MSGAETLSKIQVEISKIEKSGGDSVPLAMVKEMMTTLRDILSSDDGVHTTAAELYSEVGQLAIFLNGARKDLAQLSGGEKVMEASEHLKEALNMTEESANNIMAAAEEIQNIVAGKAEEAAVVDQTTKIFESCNFQDVTGQRMMKISDVLSKMEHIVMRMVMVFGSKVDLADEAGTGNPDDKLMSGPALKGEGLQQDQVDEILGDNNNS